MDTPRDPGAAGGSGEPADPDRRHEGAREDDPTFGGLPGGDAALESPLGGLPGQGPEERKKREEDYFGPPVGGDPDPNVPIPPPTQAPGPQGPQSPPAWAPPSGGPMGPQSPAAGGYGGPVPPGGWQQPYQPAAGFVPQGQLAGWGSRAAAYFIDGLIIFVPTMIVLGVLGVGLFASGDNDAGVAAFVVGLILTALVAFVISLIYAPILMMRSGEHNGQTWGKQILNIRAIRTNGQPFTFGSAALREVVLKNLAVNLASSIIPFIPWLLNFLWPLWDDQNQALHDMAASTRVIRA